MKLGRLSTIIGVMAVSTIFDLSSVTKPASAVSLIGLDSNNNLVFFDSSTPGATSNKGVTRVDGNLQAIDFRPANGLLYGLTDTDNLYTIDTNTGGASFVSTLSNSFNGGFQSGLDFNPAVDRLRIVGSNDQNLRFNADNGALADFDPTTPGVQPDGNLAYGSGDTNEGIDPNITGAAYTNSFPGAGAIPPIRTTALYGIDSDLDVLVLQNPPNDGGLQTVGSLGINLKPTAGFDIFSPANDVNTAYVADSALYTVDLNTGAATSLGSIGGGSSLIGLAATPVPEPSTYAGSLALIGFGVLALSNRRRQAKLSK